MSKKKPNFFKPNSVVADALNNALSKTTVETEKSVPLLHFLWDSVAPNICASTAPMILIHANNASEHITINVLPTNNMQSLKEFVHNKMIRISHLFNQMEDGDCGYLFVSPLFDPKTFDKNDHGVVIDMLLENDKTVCIELKKKFSSVNNTGKGKRTTTYVVPTLFDKTENAPFILELKSTTSFNSRRKGDEEVADVVEVETPVTEVLAENQEMSLVEVIQEEQPSMNETITPEAQA